MQKPKFIESGSGSGGEQDEFVWGTFFSLTFRRVHVPESHHASGFQTVRDTVPGREEALGGWGLRKKSGRRKNEKGKDRRGKGEESTAKEKEKGKGGSLLCAGDKAEKPQWVHEQPTVEKPGTWPVSKVQGDKTTRLFAHLVISMEKRPECLLLHFPFMQRRYFLRTPEYHFSKPESYQDQQRNFFNMQSPPEALSSPRWHWAGSSAWCQSVFSRAGKSLDPLFSEGLFFFFFFLGLFLLFSAKENNSCV